MSALAQLAVLVVLWYGATLVTSGHLSTGLLSSFMLYTLQVALIFATLSSLFGDLMQVGVGGERRGAKPKVEHAMSPDHFPFDIPRRWAPRSGCLS